ncbi:TetR/AcrR family transcriptional regulator [Lysinibacillus endophyticus]|uniref:TetR/AcrR family transcriptional regulator n=1 Tax=Ureibacillus endophyticus TaxID=1978490 RepID=UPI003134C0AE
MKTKEALQQALINLLEIKPLESISIAELCREAKVNRGTFYLHYGQIEDLFEEYFREIMRDLARSYQEPYRHVVKLKTSELDPKTIKIFHHIEKYKPFYRIVFSKNMPLTYYYLLFDEIKILLKKDRETNYQVDNTINLEYFSSYQANAILGMIIQWSMNDFEQPAHFLNEQLVKIINLE